MPKAVRIAVVEAGDSSLAADLQGLSARPTVRCFHSLFGDAEAIRRFRPSVVIVYGSGPGSEEVGAVRMLRGLLPRSSLVLAGEAGDEVELRRLCSRFEARILLLPYSPAELSASLGRALDDNDRPAEEVFLDLARGIADEINNPLMFVSGHLQLLRQNLDPSDRAAADQVLAAQEGLSRIAATVEKMRLLSRAASLNGPGEPVDLVPLLAVAVRRGERRAGSSGVRLSLPKESDHGVVTGHRALLEAALSDLARVAEGFADAGCQVSLALARLAKGPRLRLVVRGEGLEEWRLPRTFEPYFLNRILRGSPHGLGLFLVQTVVHAHGGQALARRGADGALTVDLLFR